MVAQVCKFFSQLDVILLMWMMCGMFHTICHPTTTSNHDVVFLVSFLTSSSVVGGHPWKGVCGYVQDGWILIFWSQPLFWYLFQSYSVYCPLTKAVFFFCSGLFSGLVEGNSSLDPAKHHGISLQCTILRNPVTSTVPPAWYVSLIQDTISKLKYQRSYQNTPRYCYTAHTPFHLIIDQRT